MSLICDHCGAPRQTSAASCPFCKALYGTPAPANAPPPALDAPPGVLEAIAAENLIEAIRLHRKATGRSLLEAKTAVEKLKAARG